MQMFGVGVLEVMVILIIAVLVVGPDRLPAVAADLARWIRRARVYASHVSKDFNEVIGELEKEVGANREDWQEIASVIRRSTDDVTKEVQQTADQVQKDLDAARREAEIEPAAESTGNGVAADSVSVSSEGPAEEEAVPPSIGAEEAEEEEKPWYVAERAGRRRSRE